MNERTANQIANRVAELREENPHSLFADRDLASNVQCLRGALADLAAAMDRDSYARSQGVTHQTPQDATLSLAAWSVRLLEEGDQSYGIAPLGRAGVSLLTATPAGALGN